MVKDFKDFIMRGNVVDLAVAVVIGTAFGAVVNSLVKDIVTPFIAAIIGTPDFSALSVTINGSQIMYGNFINATITFLTIAVVVFFFVIQPLNRLSKLAKKNKAEEPGMKECPECLSKIPSKAKKCMYCTTQLKLKK
jgi:large conductance mechanosensitive channel